MQCFVRSSPLLNYEVDTLSRPCSGVHSYTRGSIGIVKLHTMKDVQPKFIRLKCNLATLQANSLRRSAANLFPVLPQALELLVYLRL